MGKRKTDIDAPVLCLNKEQTAKALGLSPSEFHRRLPNLKTHGFPDPDPVLGTYPVEALAVWLRRRWRRSAVSAFSAGDNRPSMSPDHGMAIVGSMRGGDR